MEQNELCKLHVGSIVQCNGEQFIIAKIDDINLSVTYIYDQNGEPYYLDDLEGVKMTKEFITDLGFTQSKADSNVYEFKDSKQGFEIYFNFETNQLSVMPIIGNTNGFSNLISIFTEFVHEFFNALHSVDVWT